MKDKLPYFPLYVEDFEASEAVRCMNVEQVGLYFLCLLHSWREGSIPSDLGKLARTLRIEPKIVARSWDAVKSCWIQNGSPERLVNIRQESERDKAKNGVSTERVKRFRERSRNGDETVSKRLHAVSGVSPLSPPLLPPSHSPSYPRPFPLSESDAEQKCASVSFEENEVGYWKERLYELHPKKRDLPLVEHECVRLWMQKGAGAVDFFREVCRVHALWCASEGWTKENGRYAPKLAEWLGDRGWTKIPESEDLL